MARLHTSIFSFVALFTGLTACNSAYADRIAPVSSTEKALAQTPAESPYQVDLIGENGQVLDVYQHRGRFYVLGTVGQRYTIRVSNPTNRRIEALVTVDGLDVIDGQTANLTKRGYVVPAGGELRVDGFRVSTQQIATFRFSSVSGSYAGRKGKARNVGVIGVAIFEEQAPQEIIMAQPTPRPRPEPNRRNKPADYDFRSDLEDEAGDDASTASAEPAPASAPSPVRTEGRATGLGGVRGGGSMGRSAKAKAKAPSRRVSKTSDKRVSSRAPARDRGRRCCGETKKKERPGLGTEFGERRHSAVSWTRFVRANATTPTAMAELRYNNQAGLTALGIKVNPVDPHELELRESANPFPGGFARPPR